MISLWTRESGSSLGIIPERVTATIPIPIDKSFELSSLELISGNLPRGLRLQENLIIGTPFEVARPTVSKFVLRARSGDFFEDRTFSLTVEGADEPIWITQEGLLDIGPNNTLFVIDSSPVNYQFIVTDTDLPAGDVLEYFIKPGNGELPPGISLGIDGKLTGVVDPILALDRAAASGNYDSNKFSGYPYDFGVLPDNGFSSFFYDSVTYDFNLATRSPRKLNRFYEFIVSVTDGEHIVDRKFTIYVVGDDFLRSDNTIMKGDTFLFKADNTHIRTPIWLTPGNLGVRRADNYITLFLDVLDSPFISGALQYVLEDFNDDGSPSRTPPGLVLDGVTGELAGRVPYQPAVTEEYKFTVRATRVSGQLDILGINANFFEDTLMGKSSFKIFKLEQNTGGIFDALSDGIEDLKELVGRFIALGDFGYKVTAVDNTNPDFDVIFLDRTLNPEISLVLDGGASIGDESFYVSRLTQAEREKLQSRKLNFSKTETNEIVKVVPYVTWEIKSRSGSGIEIDFGSAGVDQPLPGESFKDQIKRVFDSPLGETNVEILNPNTVRIETPATSQSARNRVELVFVSPDSTADDIRVTAIRSNSDKVFLDSPLQRNIADRNNIGIALFAREGFEKLVSVIGLGEVANPFTTKTFTVKLIGEVDSIITWDSPPDLGSINANFVSTFSVKATTTVPDSRLVYNLVGGRLPPGLRLSFDGEIIGKVRQFTDGEENGLIIFDGGDFLLDGGTTTFDRVYEFTVDARDRFGFSAVQKTFKIVVLTPDDVLYSNIFMKPMLKPEQRSVYRELVSDPVVFPPELLYRPNDPEFGLQQEIKLLAYAGIETKDIEDYVSASAKNHRKRRYKIGSIKKAEAKIPGTNDVVYELIYLDVIDPAEPRQGKTRKSILSKTKNKITVDSIQYAVRDDSLKTNSGIPTLTIGTIVIVDDAFFVKVKEGFLIPVLASNGSVLLKDGDQVVVTRETDSEPFKFRPISGANTIKADTTAVKTSEGNDARRYISNITNMRDQLREVGATERGFLPLWMRTAQEGGVEELGYTLAVPLCYCKPGTGDQILLNLANRNFDFKQFDLEIDRYVIDSTTGSSEEQYILFANYQFNI